MDNVSYYLQSPDLYMRLGVISKRVENATMNWMEPDYDSRSLKEVLGNLSPAELVKELLVIFSIDTPNVDWLSYSLGKNQLFLQGDEIVNPCISEIRLTTRESNPLFRETATIDLTFNSTKTVLSEINRIVTELNAEIITLDENHLSGKLKGDYFCGNSESTISFTFEKTDYCDRFKIVYSVE